MTSMCPDRWVKWPKDFELPSESSGDPEHGNSGPGGPLPEDSRPSEEEPAMGDPS